jgi:RNase H-like domain found in reverse transcriptase
VVPAFHKKLRGPHGTYFAVILKGVQKKFIWTPEANKAFEKLKSVLTSEEVLAFPNYDVPFQIHTNASDVAIGAVLTQIQNRRPNPRVQIFQPEYLETYALQKDGVFGTFVCIIMLQDKNRVVVPPVKPKGRGGGRTQNLIIILKFLRI